MRLGAIFLICILGLYPLLATADKQAISCLGRLEPRDGVIKLAGPAEGSGVIRTLAVQEGDWVEAGQPIAQLENFELRKAEVVRLEAILRNAQRELKRQQGLATTSSTSQVKLDEATMNVEVAEAELSAARARLELAVVTAPVRAQVLNIHTRPGERIGADGILELGRTDQMYVVAEVYETDIPKVKAGQKARISLAAFEQPLTGVVESTALQVGRLDILGADPVAKTDARVVEVKILLDDGQQVSRYTNMQVEVEIAL